MEEPKNPMTSLVFGYMDMSEAPVGLGWIIMHQLQPESKEPYYFFPISDGMFYCDLVEPGIHKFEEFGGYGYRTEYTFNFPQGKNELDPVIERPGIYFVGSYKYKKVETGFFEQGKFSIAKTDWPTEKELLERLLEFAGDTIWKKRIMDRMAEIDK